MTQETVLFRRAGLITDVGLADGRPFPPQVCDVLCRNLTYQHKRFLRGSERHGADGTTRNIEFTTRRLYDFTATRLQTGFGMVPRLVRLLRGFNYACTFQDLTRPPAHPEAYTPNWEHLARFVDMETGWRPKQLECLESMSRALGGIVAAPPAFGKSEIISRFGVLYPRAKIAVVTRRKDVAITIERRLRHYLPQVGFVGNNKRTEHRVTVFIAASAKRAQQDYDFVIGDEIHELAADSYSADILRTFTNARMFGLSATWDGRTDGAQARLEYMFGPVIFEMDWREATALGLIVPVEVRWINVVMSRNPCGSLVSDVSRKRHGLWQNATRNSLLAETARQYGPDEQVLILVETLEHAVHLSQYLPEFALCYGDMDAADVLSYQARGLLPQDYVPVNAARREEMRQAFEAATLRKVIATDVWSTGVSFEQLAVLIRADGRASEILDDQAPGRVVRQHAASGKSMGIIHDCYDYFDDSFKRKSQERYRRYEHKNWTQVRVPVLFGET